MVLEQPLPQVLLMPLPDPLPRVLDQSVPFQGLVNPRPLERRLIGTLPGYGNIIDDIKQPKVTVRHPSTAIYRKLFDEIQDEVIFRKHLP